MAVVRIVDLHWTRYRIPFKRPLATAHGVFPYREGAIVEAVGEDGAVGIGDVAPPPGFGISLDEALIPLSQLAHEVRQDGIDANSLLLRPLPPALRFGLETACCAWATPSLPADLVTPRCVSVNRPIVAADRDEAVDRARLAVNQGYRCIKLKVGTCETVDAEVERIAAVRGAIRSSIHLRLDANEAWDFERACSVLETVACHDIQFCEQPLNRDDLAGMRQLRASQPVPIAADEAVTDSESVHRILAADAADVLVLKPQCIGSGSAMVQLAVLDIPRSVGCVVTSAMESGIGVAATLVWAYDTALTRPLLECGLATLDLLEDDLITSPPAIEDGQMCLADGPGFGVELDRAALARCAL